MRSALFSSLAAACLAVGVSATTVASPPRISDATLSAADLAGEVTLCGSVGDYLAPSSTADGSITISGVTAAGGPSPFVIAAGTPVASGDGARLVALSAAGSFTCLNVTIAASGTITALSIPVTAAFHFGWVDRVGGNYRLWPSGSPEVYTHLTDEAADIVAADLDLDSFLRWFARPEGADLGLGTVTFSMAADGSLVRMSLDGREMICGDVGDTSADGQTAIFELGSGLAPAPTVSVAGIQLPSRLLDNAALGVMELAYVDQNYTDPAAAEAICLVAVIGDTELVALEPESGTALACGRRMMHATLFEGISEDAPQPAWTVTFPDELLGYVTPEADLPNLTIAWLSPMEGSPPFCAEGQFRQGTMSLSGHLHATVTSRSSAAIGFDSVTEPFQITPGSQVDASLVVGTQACVGITAFSGADGPVRIERSNSCANGAGNDGTDGEGGAPDAAMGAHVPERGALLSAAGFGLLLIAAAWVARRRLSAC